MKIVNNSCLSNEKIGRIIDFIQNRDNGETHYYNQLEYVMVGLNNVKVEVLIRYLKKYTEWIFNEVK